MKKPVFDMQVESGDIGIIRVAFTLDGKKHEMIYDVTVREQGHIKVDRRERFYG